VTLSKTVLIIDNDEDWLALLERLLADAGYDVLKAQDGAGAMRLMGVARPDCVLSDLKLGCESGLKLCAAIKSAPGLGRVPVIILSGAAEPPESCGRVCDGYVCKTDGTAAILAAIKKVIK